MIIAHRTMTLDEFRASKRECADLRTDPEFGGDYCNSLGDAEQPGAGGDYDRPIPGFFYAGGYHIQKVEPWWTDRSAAFCLTLGSEQPMSYDLGELESQLYDAYGKWLDAA